MPDNTETVAAPASEQLKRDFRQGVTDQIIAMLEKGTAPWQKPWEPGSFHMPFNPTTEKGYRGGSALHLMAVAVQKSYGDPRWLTYRQAQENGWQVKKGEKGAHIEYWQFNDRNSRDERQSPADDGAELGKDGKDRSNLIHRIYTVFNASQIEGVPPMQPRQPQEWEVAHTGEQILQNSGATIRHDQADRAFYNRGRDEIHLPPKDAFKSAANYYGTALPRTRTLEWPPDSPPSADSQRDLFIRRSQPRQRGAPRRTRQRLPCRRTGYPSQPGTARRLRRLVDQRPPRRQELKSSEPQRTPKPPSITFSASGGVRKSGTKLRASTSLRRRLRQYEHHREGKSHRAP